MEPESINERAKICVSLSIEDKEAPYEEDIRSLHEKYPKSDLVFIADSSLGKCCVDRVAASHLGINHIIKFGEVCDLLSQDVTIAEFDLVSQSLQEYKNFLNGELVSKFKWISICSRNLLDCEELCKYVGSLSSQVRIFPSSHVFDVTDEHEHEAGAVLLVSSVSWQVSLAQVCMPNVTFILKGPDGALSSRQGHREKTKRWAILEKVSPNTQSLGIVINSTVEEDKEVAFLLAQKLKSAGKAAFIISCGKLTPTKLGNFTELDAFVIVGCQREVFQPEMMYFKPLLTPFEALCILNMCEFWSSPYLIFASQVKQVLLATQPTDVPRDPLEIQTDQSISEITSSYAVMSFESRNYKGVPSSLAHDNDQCDNSISIMKGLRGIPRSYN